MERKTVVIAQSDLERQKAVCEQIREYWLAQGRTPLAFVDTYGCQQNEADSERIRGHAAKLRAISSSVTRRRARTASSSTRAPSASTRRTRVYGNVGALVHTKARPSGAENFPLRLHDGAARRGRPHQKRAIAMWTASSTHTSSGVSRNCYSSCLRTTSASSRPTTLRAMICRRAARSCAASDLKAWVSIMYGCNNFCSYCIVPYVRGPRTVAPAG